MTDQELDAAEAAAILEEAKRQGYTMTAGYAAALRDLDRGTRDTIDAREDPFYKCGRDTRTAVVESVLAAARAVREAELTRRFEEEGAAQLAAVVVQPGRRRRVSPLGA